MSASIFRRTKRRAAAVGMVLGLLFFLCEPAVSGTRACAASTSPQQAAPTATLRQDSGSNRVGEVAASTRAMARLLAEQAERNESRENPYARSRVRIAAYEERIAAATMIGEELELRFFLAKELLKDGRSRDAVHEFLRVFSVLYENHERVPPEELLEVWKYLALANLRHGEVENCLHHHSRQSCIFPIAGEGVHLLPQGSRAAIAVYQSLLKQFPDDLSSRYLLNVAYMTLGQYPHGVPPQWLIPPDRFASEHPFPEFRDVASKLGVDVNALAGGVVVEDLNGDGFLDLVVSSYSLRDQLRVFLHDGKGGFVDATPQSGLEGITGGLNLIHADYNNDGRPDILVLRGGWEADFGQAPNSLLRNDGDGHFTDVTEEAGLLAYFPTQTAAWGDYNNDGHLDLFVGNESMLRPKAEGGGGQLDDNPCALYLNLGNGRFIDVAPELGVAVRGYIKAALWGDYDNDGFLDLFLSNMQGHNLLFRNLGPDETGKWRFVEVAEKAGVQRPVESFTSWFFDYNNDGWLDLFVAGYSATRVGETLVARDTAIEYLGLPREAERLWLYENQRDGTFRDVTAERGLDHVVYTMGANYGDLDGDGFPEIYLGSGEPDFHGITPNRMFRNDAGRRFQDVTTAGGFGHLQKGHGVAFADFDNDGDADVYLVVGGVADSDTYPNALFENPGFNQPWLSVELVGTASPRTPIGARIEVQVESEAGVRSIFSYVYSGGSFGAGPFRRLIGLAGASGIRQLTVTWPGRSGIQTFQNIPLNTALRVVQGEPNWERRDLPHRPFRLEPSGPENAHDQSHHHR